MPDFDSMLCDLEWQRVRRRLTMPPLIALLCNAGTAALIFILRHTAPALAR